MNREAVEEIGVNAFWHHFISLDYPEAHVAFFCLVDEDAFDQAEARTSERLERVLVDNIDNELLIPNLRFLIPMAVHAALREPITPVDIPMMGSGNAISTPHVAAVGA